MIVRVEHPNEPDVQVFVPLCPGSRIGEWVPILGPGEFFYQEVDAARVCLSHAREATAALAQDSLMLRILSDPDSFYRLDAHGKLVPVGDQGHAVADRAELVGAELENLLSEPGDEDDIVIADKRLRVDAISGALPALQGLMGPLYAGVKAVDLDSPDDLFLHLVAVSLKLAGDMSGAPVTRAGVARAMAWLMERGLTAVDHIRLTAAADDQEREP